jgi:DNA-directed RNA polymerase specialized sigma24 family protein
MMTFSGEISPEQVELITRLYKEGVKIIAIAADAGCSRTTVAKYARRAGLFREYRSPRHKGRK